MSKAKSQFWLSWRNSAEKIWLPVNPLDEFTGGSPTENESIDIIGAGEATIIKKPRLKTWSFSTFFPRHYAPYCNYTDLQDPWELVQQIQKWKDSAEPVRFIVTGEITPLNYAVTIEEFSYHEKAGEIGDIWFSISLKEYKFLKPETVKKDKKKPAPSATKPRPAPATAAPKNHVVKKGESLWTISKKVYGKGSEWRVIYNANKKTIGSDPDKLRPGMKLTIPPKKK